MIKDSQDQAHFTMRGRNPDVLTCIANLSNDEVFTPPEFANRMLDTLAEACREPLTAYEAAQVLFPRATGELPQVGFTVGETLAHLRRLERQGRVMAEPGAGEAVRFRTRA
jgi:hypothetical protein